MTACALCNRASGVVNSFLVASKGPTVHGHVRQARDSTPHLRHVRTHEAPPLFPIANSPPLIIRQHTHQQIRTKGYPCNISTSSCWACENTFHKAGYVISIKTRLEQGARLTPLVHVTSNRVSHTLFAQLPSHPANARGCSRRIEGYRWKVSKIILFFCFIRNREALQGRVRQQVLRTIGRQDYPCAQNIRNKDGVQATDSNNVRVLVHFWSEQTVNG